MLALNLLKSKSIQRILRPIFLQPLKNISKSQTLLKEIVKLNDNSIKRTHYCGSLDLSQEGQKVFLCGWLQSTRFSNFLILRDIHGLVQVFLNEEFFKNNPSFSVENLTNESVLSISGIVRRRPEGQENLNMKTGLIEVLGKDIEVLNLAKPKLPFTITKFNRANDTIRLEHRYLDLRFSKLQQNLILRSNFVQKCREFLHANNFIDIETPTLFRRTPGGAREFIVPTKISNQFYCLTQSPQQFKQLLMIAGLDRYYQVARCYRDESTKPDRQPEFTQIDIEMSFIDENDCINLVESLVKTSWPFEDSKPVTPFERMKFRDAIKFYGIDKPDLRFDMKFSEITNLFKNTKTNVEKLDKASESDKFRMFGFKLPLNHGDLESNKIEKEYKELFKNTFFNSIDSETKDSFVFIVLKSENDGNRISKFLNPVIRNKILEELKVNGETVVLLASKNETKLLEILGKLRLRLADVLDEAKKPGEILLRDPNKYRFLWVVDFPLFTMNEETNKIESSHHPFTAPIKEHVKLLKEKKDLESIIGLHYDLVLNGNEIAGGSIRIHDSNLQRHVLENVLGENTEQLEHLLNALEYGAPPHGGIALGLDRFIAVLCGTTNIRDVIAFPKAHSGRDLMSNSPASVPQTELDYYNIKCVENQDGKVE